MTKEATSYTNQAYCLLNNYINQRRKSILSSNNKTQGAFLK